MENSLTITAKKAAAKKAVEWVEDEMIVGLGSGSTAAFFIEELTQIQKEKKMRLKTVSSSKKSEELARKGGLIVVDIDSVSSIDITFDGADEIDLEKRMIKGAGGAHVREKILASSSREMVVLIDETKRVTSLGKKALPLEILPYGALSTQKRIEALGFLGNWRLDGASPFLTDNGNLLLDIELPFPLKDPEGMEACLLRIPGVVDTGFFFHLAGRVIVGYFNGKSEVF